MTPRKYAMDQRSRTRDKTRQRIVEATAKLHGEHGVLGTSWRDIAREADVSVATVYAHFPSLEELLPACGRHVMERVRPPQASQASEVVGNALDPQERLLRVARELFAFYDRGGPHIEVDIRERQLPGMVEWEEHQRATVLAFVRTALGSTADARTAKRVAALFDLPTYKALRTRGAGKDAAAQMVAQLAVCFVGGLDQRTKEKR